jgi:disulfide bond formation protein DsbB
MTDEDVMAVIAYVRTLAADAGFVPGSVSAGGDTGDADETEVPAVAAQPTDTPAPTSTPVPPTATLPPPTESPPTEEPATDSGAGAAAYDPELVARGQTSFILCSACHGPDARGLPGLGKDMLASEFILSLTDEELLDFIKVGRPVWDATNTTGVDMPAKGGNPAMTDEDVMAVIAYIRTLAADAGFTPSSG